MATYAVGDIQGCYSALSRLLEVIEFDAGNDRLWFVGDLVNRGPDSLAVLRFVKGLGETATIVLGNHDLHLLARAVDVTPRRRTDTLDDVLAAPDREELLHWLRRQPLLYREGSTVLVHAGLLPSWTVEGAIELAQEVEQALRADDYSALLAGLYDKHNRKHEWSEQLAGLARLCTITNVFTRLRVCNLQGTIALSYKGPPDQAPDGFMPWFSVPGRRSANALVICGHWSALGLRLQDNLVALDSGCVWGGGLSALRLDDRQLYHVPCRGK